MDLHLVSHCKFTIDFFIIVVCFSHWNLSVMGVGFVLLMAVFLVLRTVPGMWYSFNKQMVLETMNE